MKSGFLVHKSIRRGLIVASFLLGLSLNVASVQAGVASKVGAIWPRLFYVHPKNSEIVELAHQITEHSYSDREKVIAIFDWVSSNISYNYHQGHIRPHEDYDALVVLHNRTGICGGYSNLTASLLVASGISAKLVVGWAESKTPGMFPDHQWNKALIDGQWYSLDATQKIGIDANPSEFGILQSEITITAKRAGASSNEQVRQPNPSAAYPSLTVRNVEPSRPSPASAEAAAQKKCSEIYQGTINESLKTSACNYGVEAIFSAVQDGDSTKVSYLQSNPSDACNENPLFDSFWHPFLHEECIHGIKMFLEEYPQT